MHVCVWYTYMCYIVLVKTRGQLSEVPSLLCHGTRELPLSPIVRLSGSTIIIYRAIV